MNALVNMQEKEIFIRSFFENSFFESDLLGMHFFGAEGELLLQVQGSCEDQQAENLKLREIFSSLN